MRQYFLIVTEKNREIKRSECIEIFPNQESDIKALIKAINPSYANRSNMVVSIKEGARFDKGVLNAIRVLYNTLEANKWELKEKDIKKAEKASEMADLKLVKVLFGFSYEYGHLAFMQEQHDKMVDNLKRTEECMKYLSDTELEVDAYALDLNGIYTSSNKLARDSYNTLHDSFYKAQDMYNAFFSEFSKELKDNFIKKTKAETDAFKEVFANDMLEFAKEGIDWETGVYHVSIVH